MAEVKVLLCTKNGFDFWLSESSVGEIERIRIQSALEQFDYELRPKVKVKDVIAYGKSYEVTKKDAERFIDSRGEGDHKRFRCYNYCSKNYEYQNHYDALSSWNCIIERLGYPSLCILYRIPIKDREETWIEQQMKEITEAGHREFIEGIMAREPKTIIEEKLTDVPNNSGDAEVSQGS